MTGFQNEQYLESLKQARNTWLDKLAYFQEQLSFTSSAATTFELRQRIKECRQQHEIITKDIESWQKDSQQIERITKDINFFQEHSNQKTLEQNKLEIFDYLCQQVNDIPIVDRPIEIFSQSQKTEPIVSTDWQVKMQFWMLKLEQNTYKQGEISTIAVDDVIQMLLSPNFSPREARALSSFAMQCLVMDVNWKEDTVIFAINKAIDNINDFDGFNNNLNTSIDKAFYAVMQSRFGSFLQKKLLEKYIQARDIRRNHIGCIFLNTKIINSQVVDASNATQILIPLLEKLSVFCSIEERVDSALSLVNIFFRAQIQNNDVKIGFLSNILLREVIKVLLTAIEQETTSNYGLSTAAIWATVWLTNAKTSHSYTAYTFSERELDVFRRVVVNEKHDIFARSNAALILSICNSKATIFFQADWIYQWAVVADGAKPQRDLPKVACIDHSKEIDVIKRLIFTNLPSKVKRNTAVALGRLGFFIPEMVDSLLEIFKDETYLWEQRDEALVYLVFISNSKVISELIRGANQPENNTDKYGLRDRCFLALIGMGNVAVLKYQLDQLERTYISGYAYALAGVASPLGRQVLKSMINHQNKEIRNVVIDALRKFKK
ncbi:hypothetical protein I8752_29605 [Nostocaceae cyanobacterium CENA369]|uniref:HEAT repeat domain-containing protein n=1 Tax=Dendronalium phyllosphericum CENA369 TaxID=1725256 RepID=A0A8J7I6M7_9NOST|nr:hypothetical protein [Dendronalium phyllosphericum]MBH8577065.1 hypothetical protein [Dendronalium phyllosphericum CENA369]